MTVEVDESAVDLILREGYSPEYGARNLERVMDRLLGTLIADRLLNGLLIPGQMFHLEKNGVIQPRQA